jgi:hypothetical protein
MLAAVWARGRLRDLEDRYAVGTADLRALEREIVDLSLRFGVLCRFTAFVAVDWAETVNEGGRFRGIVQPVEPPSGWTALGDGAPSGGGISVDSCLTEFSDRAASDGTQSDVFETDLEVPALDLGDDEHFGEALDEKDSSEEFELLLEDAQEEASGRDAGGRVSGATPRDRDDLRQRLEQFLHELRTAPSDGRDGWLRGRLPQLEELVKDVAASGVPEAAVKRLEEARDRVQALLAEAQPAAAAVAEVWARLEEALAACLAELTPAGGRREGFWK